MTTRTTVFATNDVLTANDLNALAGEWNTYTPTLGAFTAGNGTAAGRYLQFGKLVLFRAKFTFGSTSAAATGLPTLSLPVSAQTDTPSGSLQGILYDLSSSAPYIAACTFASATTAAVGLLGTNGLRSNCTTTTPFTWAVGDIVMATGFYEAA